MPGVEIGTKATHRDLFPLAAGAVDRYTGNPLQRFGQILVGEFADIFGGNRVDDAAAFAFGLHRIQQAAADAFDDDRGDVIALRPLCRGYFLRSAIVDGRYSRYQSKNRI
jgi:hypothetical protein